MRNVSNDFAVEKADNSISLLSGQLGLCAMTGMPLGKDKIICYYKNTRIVSTNWK